MIEFLALLALSVAASDAVADIDYRDDIGLTLLTSQIGAAAVPTGKGLSIGQVEASTSSNPATPVYAPDQHHPEFAGKSFHFPGPASQGASGHATGVGRQIYAKSLSLTPGIADITSYSVDYWLATLLQRPISLINSNRLVNHSWVGNAIDSATSTNYNGPALRRADWLVHRFQQIQVAATSDAPLMANAYNAIAVVPLENGKNLESIAIPGDPAYVSGRARPDITVPVVTASQATAAASSAVALLVSLAHDRPTLSKGSGKYEGTGLIYFGERAETIKAALMAGASRATSNRAQNSATPPAIVNITDYRSLGHESKNGLDRRYGAGQINISNSYHIIAAGEQNSVEDGEGEIKNLGFDHDPEFGGLAESNAQSTYRFNADKRMELSATLAWNLAISNDDALTPAFRRLYLRLYDTTSSTTGRLLTSSESPIDNTQNITAKLESGHHYELRISTPETAFLGGYSLAWQILPLHEPGAKPTESKLGARRPR